MQDYGPTPTDGFLTLRFRVSEQPARGLRCATPVCVELLYGRSDGPVSEVVASSGNRTRR